MTFNELFSTIGENLSNVFHYLGNTPIEEMFHNVLILVLALLIIFVAGWTIVFCLYLIGKLMEKVFPNKKKVGWMEKETPLKKQSMYKMGRKMKMFFSKNNKKK